MSDRDALTPRVFICRHGETEWARLGRFTGITDLELTQAGVAQVSSAAATLVGNGKLLDPHRLAQVFVSPRVRAVTTLQLLLPDCNIIADKIIYTERIAEWHYGDYEGLTALQISDLRKHKGLDQSREWDIWRDGCEGGESAQQVTERVDELISQINGVQKPYMGGEKPADVLVVAHGLVLRCFVKRWLGLTIDSPLSMILPPGGIGIVSYKNNDVNKPALYVGMALPTEAKFGQATTRWLSRILGSIWSVWMMIKRAACG